MTTDQLTLDLDDVSVDTISIGSGSYTIQGGFINVQLLYFAILPAPVVFKNI